MRPFAYVDERSVAEAAAAVHAAPGAMFLAGGTTLVDLMRQGVLAPDVLVDVHRLPLGDIELDDRRARIGACVRNAQLAEHPELRARWPVVGEALLSSMSPQLRNMSTVAGNILQRTRCSYYRDRHSPATSASPAPAARRSAATTATTRSSAPARAASPCSRPTSPPRWLSSTPLSTPAAATAAPAGCRSTAFTSLPARPPSARPILDHGELVTHLELPALALARHSHYFKVGDRSSYAFALASAAVALDVERGIIRDARIALGGVATRPWRCPDAEQRCAASRPRSPRSAAPPTSRSPAPSPAVTTASRSTSPATCSCAPLTELAARPR